jgi:hypothetical protein
MYEPKHLKLWTMPSNYTGAVWPAYYSSGVGQSRDSDALERSNFECMLKAIGGESDTVQVVRESHWAVGWVEWIAIHQDDSKALEIADDIKAKLADYPAINEDHWSELEWNESADYWDSLSPREKVRMAMDVRSRYHWLSSEPVWQYGRYGFCDIPDTTIGRALEEMLREV